MSKGINVTSEFGKLKKVLLHRPGEETESLTPETFEELLFDDSYYLPKAQEEHDAFAEVLRSEGVEVVYIEELVAETLDLDKKIYNEFVEKFIIEAGVDKDSEIFPIFVNYINNYGNTTKDKIVKMIAGIRYSELGNTGTLIEETAHEIFVAKPMPNIIFQRDPFASIVNGISLHSMHFETRRRETLFAGTVFEYHPDYKDVTKYYDRTNSSSLEGGDVMMLNSENLAVGISQRTKAQSIERLAKNIFSDKSNTIKNIYAVDIPKGRSWMHLDTVFTQIDKHTFSIYENAPFAIYKITDAGNNKINAKKITKNIEGVMEEVFGGKAKLLKCGNGDPIDGAREQWNDGSNVLAIAPNKIIAYERNYKTVQMMREAGVEVITIPSSELSRGRGGPRCMSMPLEREEI